MALHPEAGVIRLRDLESERRQVLAQIHRDLRAVHGITNPTAEQTAHHLALLDKQLVLGDIGRYGALRGYDAIDGSDTFSNDEWVILNRTALLVQR